MHACHPVFPLFVIAFSVVYGNFSPAAEFMFRASVGGQTIEGKPLDWTDSMMTLLGRDGQLHEFNPHNVTDARKTAPRFEAFSDREMRGLLYEEFQGRFDFTSTSHFLVVHPKGERSVWANRFERIYQAFTSYIRVRGFPVRNPDFPLVAIVFRNRAEYDRHLRASGAKVLPNTLGCYSHRTNRVCLFDQTNDDSGDWADNAVTIIHEATHQIAFNLGVHSRTSPPPYWIPEGLATLFEARGVWSPRGGDRRADRINRSYLNDFRRFSKTDALPFSLREFIASDTPFRRNGAAAYAQAWALSFFLSETQPRNYCHHLASTADRPVYSAFSAGERAALFREAFGEDIKILEANFMRWIKGLK